MKRELHPSIERHRVTDGPRATTAADAPVGMYIIPGPIGSTLAVIADNGRDWDHLGFRGDPWEHVIVSARPDRKLSLREIDFVREEFWELDEHSKVALHWDFSKGGAVHLWRPLGVVSEFPPTQRLSDEPSRIVRP